MPCLLMDESSRETEVTVVSLRSSSFFLYVFLVCVMDMIDEFFRVTIDSGNCFDLLDLLFWTWGFSDKAADLC
jgi:hypothetical protein